MKTYLFFPLLSCKFHSISAIKTHRNFIFSFSLYFERSLNYFWILTFFLFCFLRLHYIDYEEKYSLLSINKIVVAENQLYRPSSFHSFLELFSQKKCKFPLRDALDISCVCFLCQLIPIQLF